MWQALSARPAIAEKFRVAIGHADVAWFAFSPSDRVWVFAYSRKASRNSELLEHLARAGVREVVYVSSASTIVLQQTRCYEYPRVKHAAEVEAQRRLDARVLTLGLVYDAIDELPAGCTAATSQAQIAEFLLAPNWSDDGDARVRLFALVDRPFRSSTERLLYRWYGRAMTAASAYPCVLRPLDFLLRAFGMRWYGYLFLSNRLWMSTML